MGAEKTLKRLLSGTADAAVRFDDLCRLLARLGFEERVHHIFRESGVEEKIKSAASGREREAVPSETGSGGHPEGEAWFQNDQNIDQIQSHHLLE